MSTKLYTAAFSQQTNKFSILLEFDMECSVRSKSKEKGAAGIRGRQGAPQKGCIQKGPKRKGRFKEGIEFVKLHSLW